MTTFIKIPFAQSGDKVNPPDTDAAGGVNWTQGYPAAYSKDPATDPSAKRIEREDFNGVLNRLSTAINEIQVGGAAPWISPADNGGAARPYSAGNLVSYNNIIWISLIDNNTGIPSIANNWMAAGGPCIGDVVFRARNKPPVQPGAVFMLANGAIAAPTSYPYYAATVEASGVLPDYRGRFLRILDNGKGADVNRQPDSQQNEQVNFSTLKFYGSGGGVGNATVFDATTGVVGIYTNGITQGQIPGVVMQAFSPTDGETRPTNIAITAYVRVG